MRSPSVFLTAVVSLVLGLLLGVVGLAAVTRQFNPSAEKVAEEQKDQAAKNNQNGGAGGTDELHDPAIYGAR